VEKAITSASGFRVTINRLTLATLSRTMLPELLSTPVQHVLLFVCEAVLYFSRLVTVVSPFMALEFLAFSLDRPWFAMKFHLRKRMPITELESAPNISKGRSALAVQVFAFNQGPFGQNFLRLQLPPFKQHVILPVDHTKVTRVLHIPKSPEPFASFNFAPLV